jgi:hypothetical protein
VCILPLKLATVPPFDSPQQSTRRARARLQRSAVTAFSEATRVSMRSRH